MDELSKIQNLIFVIRGQRVMFDFDLAKLYGVETKRLNEAVKRNIERFPGDFMFQVSHEELQILTKMLNPIQEKMNETTAKSGDIILRSQIATSRFLDKWGGSRRPPFAFTEQGVAMLSSVLRSSIAIKVNIGIMRAFVQFRQIMVAPMPENYVDLRKQIEAIREEMNDILADQNDINESTRAQLDAISTALAELQSKEPRQKPRPHIGFIQPKDDDS